MSRRLRTVAFEPDTILDHAAEALSPLRGVRLFPENKKRPDLPRDYAVVIFVAQKERIIGKTRSLTAACRFSDMAKMRFFKYRQRHAVEPTDDDLNFSVAQAKSDLQFETAAIALLDDIEAHFREKGFWKDTPTKEIRRSDVKSERWTLGRAVRTLETEIEIIKEKLDGLILLAQLQPDTFKHGGSPIDDPAIHGKTDEVSLEANKKLVQFRVHVPHPFDAAKVHHSVTIAVEARIENGLEILTPDSLAMIERVRAEELQILKEKFEQCRLAACTLVQEAKQITDPIAELIPTI